MRGRSTRRVRGQVAVETILTMPLFVFIILGMLQLGLLHQGRVMAKYAAYKAVRTGSIHNAKMAAMKKAALAVLLPYTGRRTSDTFFSATTQNFGQSWQQARQLNDRGGLDRLLDITICDPTTPVSGDFDDPLGGMGVNGDWRQFNKGRLAVQVTFYAQMVIPFVNGVIWHITNGTEQGELMRTLRMGDDRDSQNYVRLNGGSGRTISTLLPLTQNRPPVYVMPIRASWSMRMQSNYFPDRSGFQLPARNDCKIGWNKG